jgi:aspartate/glutamate racemase
MMILATLAIIHTTTATVETLRELATSLIPGVQIINFVDDSILPQLARNGGNVAEVAERLVHYARFAQAAGADAVLEACSSVGEVVEQMQRAVTIPVVRIDAAMAQEAVGRGARIGVAATLPTTLAPTTALLRAAAHGQTAPVAVEPVLVEGAYERLMAGDRAGHDALLVAALTDLAQRVDVVVLAQASMARVTAQLPEHERARFLTSPRLALTQIKALFDKA